MKLLGTASIPSPQRILFIQLRRIGDVLLGTPAVRAVSEHFPETSIDFVVEPPADEAMWGNPRIDRLLVAPRSNGVQEWLRFVSQIREQQYDWTIDFFSNPRSAQFAFLSGAKVRMGLNRWGRRWAYTHRIIEEAEDRDLYAVDWRLKALSFLGVPSQGLQLEVYADNVDAGETRRALKILDSIPESAPIAAVSTGTINPAKLYPPDLTAEVIRGLRRDGFSVVITAGPGETTLAEKALELVKEPLPFLRGARVPTLAALYRHVNVYVGPDSAPKHVACACGLPTVTIYGHGRISNWHDASNPRNVVVIPPGGVPEDCDLAQFVQREYMRKIPPEDVVQAAEKLLSGEMKRAR